MDSLTGQFLIATPRMGDPRFQEAVILICSHDEGGAFGLVLNHPFPEMNMLDVLASFEISSVDHSLPPVLLGGPVEMETAFFLHSTDYPLDQGAGLMVSEDICLSRSPALLRDLAAGQGPSQCLFLLGYAGWGPGQLEEELCGEGWLPLPASSEDVFQTPTDKMWKKVTANFGIDITLYDDVAGNA